MRSYSGWFLFIVLMTATGVMAASLQVHVRSTPLREMPSFLSGTIMEIHYGQPVEVLSEQNDWRRVQVQGTETTGWVHAKALTDQKIELASGNALSGKVSADELALAGKGFSPEVEAAFRTENQGLNYADINRMESFTVSPEESRVFLQTGDLHPKGGLK